MSSGFKNEVFSSYENHPVRLCNLCGEKPALVRTMLDSLSGRTFHLFRCNCGLQSWDDDRR